MTTSLTPLGQFRVKVGKESVTAVKEVEAALGSYGQFLRASAEKHDRALYPVMAKYAALAKLVKAAGFQMEQVFPGMSRAWAVLRSETATDAERRQAVEGKFNPELAAELEIGTSPVVVQEHKSLWSRSVPKNVGEDFHQLAGLTPVRLPRRESTEIGKTIIQQMGGPGKLRAMISANFSFTPSGLIMQWPSRKPTKGNVVEIELLPNDTYEMRFFHVSARVGRQLVKRYDNIYFDALVPTFERQTGLALKL